MSYKSPIVGEQVTVSFRSVVGTDSFGDDVFEYTEPVVVENVLVNPFYSMQTGFTVVNLEEGHPQQSDVFLMLYWPKDFDHDMRGAHVVVRGIQFEVIGDPYRYTDANIPVNCDWNLVTKVVRYDG